MKASLMTLNSEAIPRPAKTMELGYLPKEDVADEAD